MAGLRGRGAARIMLLAVLPAVMAPGCSARGTGPSAGPGSPPSQSASTVETSAPTTPGSGPATLADAMRQWEAVAGDHFTESASALKLVAEASAAEDESSLRTGCTQLHDANTVGLQRDLPTPDPHLTGELQRMIDDINTATHACLRFVLTREDADAQTYRDYLARAIEHLHRAKEVLDADLAPK